MANDGVPDPINSTSSTTDQPESNEYGESNREIQTESDPVRERFRLRAQCAKLRNWYRDLLSIKGSAGTLPPEVEQELLTTPPGMSMDEVLSSLRAISQGESLPVAAAYLSDDVTALGSERRRLSGFFFKLFDAVSPDEAMTDEFFQELSEQPAATESIRELLDRWEREPEDSR